jgi:hypothetical protein
MGCGPDFCRCGGQPLLKWLSAVQRMQRRLEDRGTRPVTGKVEPDTTRITRDDRREFEQLIAQGRDLPLAKGAPLSASIRRRSTKV